MQFKLENTNIISATIVSIIVMIILLTLITLMFMRQGTIDPALGDFAKLLAGAITAKFSTVVDYWMGASYSKEDNSPKN
jgi:hypothetical protein